MYHSLTVRYFCNIPLLFVPLSSIAAHSSVMVVASTASHFSSLTIYAFFSPSFFYIFLSSDSVYQTDSFLIIPIEMRVVQPKERNKKTRERAIMVALIVSK